MAITHLIFTHVPTIGSNDCARVNIADLNGNPTTPDGPLEWTSNDGGAVIDLGFENTGDNVWPGASVTACAVGVGTAVVTCTGYENGAVVTGTATVTVTSVAGKLQTAWSSGTGLTIL